ncbi:MAG: hypothetical protein EPN93_05400 [Spirochaetes bacterium]|nr:MAG: hypothetical protein EPN93_05400 [Spirochaetota bacterium]
MGISKKKQGFPFGIFFLMFFFLILLSAAISGGYFYQTVSTRTAEIEENVKKYSTAIVEAFANVAGLNFPMNNYAELKKLFSVRLTDAENEEAFFILADGRIVAHSSAAAEQQVEGNVANDEFRYNMEQLLQPVNQNAREAQFYDYNIQDQKVPFDRQLRQYIKEYLYPEINSPGWLATRAVFVWDRPVGTVNLIISKQPIYTLIFAQFEESVIIGAALGIFSFILSLFIACIVYFRYRGFRGEPIAAQPVFAEQIGALAHAGAAFPGAGVPGGASGASVSPALERVVTYSRPGPPPLRREGMGAADRTVIRDAIPVKKR